MGSWIADGEERRHYTIQGNVVAHMHRALDAERAAGLHAGEGRRMGSLTLRDNAIYRPNGGRGLRVASDGWLHVELGGNRVAVGPDRGGGGGGGEVIGGATATAGGSAHHIGDALAGGNLYWTPSAAAFGGGSFSTWRASREDLDSMSWLTDDFEEFRALAGWTDPERDIVSYLLAVDASYVPDEEVTVDAGVPPALPRSTAPPVWRVLRDNPAWPRGMSEPQARQTARRYHAFVHFIERARANRRGAWDPRYTAHALNTYIREGFGMEPVSGPYSTEYPRPLR